MGASFTLEIGQIEIYGTTSGLFRNPACVHIVAEDRNLSFASTHFKSEIISLKKSGIKTEPSFASAGN